MPAPTLSDAKAYLGDASSYSDEQVQDALDAESAAQARRCRVGDYPADLGQALLRRVQRNLYMRSLPSGMQTAFTEIGASFVRVGADPEVRRLEGPFRRVTVG